MPSGWFPHAVAGTSWRVARLRRTIALVLLCAGVIGLLLFPRVAQATTDYDQDDDGLIEVNSLARLNAIRWDLDGDGAADPVYWDHDDDPNTLEQIDESTTEANANSYAAAFPNPLPGMGCPTTDDDADADDCTGYELTANLDFDSDNDGDVDAADASSAYWNDGAGWVPIGSFAATFDGNDHTIANLHISRPTTESVGLFGSVGAAAHIRQIRLKDLSVIGATNVGRLVGVNRGSVKASYATGTATAKGTGPNGGGTVGGLVGDNQGSIEASSATGTVTDAISGGAVGGIVGGLVGVNRGSVKASYATGTVTQDSGDVAIGGYVGGLVGWNTDTGSIQASYTTATATLNTRSLLSNHGARVGGLVGANGGSIEASYATGTVTNSSDSEASVGGLVGVNSGTASHSYWDTETSEQETGSSGEGKTTAELQTPTRYTGIYAGWNLDLDGDSASDDPWDFGTASQYPVLKVDFNGDGSINADDINPQRLSPKPPPPPKPKTTSTSSNGSSSSRVPAPPPAPTRSPLIGSTPAATAKELAGDLLVLQRHDQPGVEIEVGVGWMSQDGQRIITIGFVRDGDLGQTYAVVRREGDGQVVRRWIAPDSHLVYAVPWAAREHAVHVPGGGDLGDPAGRPVPVAEHADAPLRRG